MNGATPRTPANLRRGPTRSALEQLLEINGQIQTRLQVLEIQHCRLLDAHGTPLLSTQKDLRGLIQPMLMARNLVHELMEDWATVIAEKESPKHVKRTSARPARPSAETELGFGEGLSQGRSVLGDSFSGLRVDATLAEDLGENYSARLDGSF